MAKRKYGINEVKAITQADLLQRNMSDAELKILVRDASAIANERIRRLEKSGMAEFSRAYRSNVREKHQRFGVKGKTTRDDLKNEFKAIRSFLEMKTSTSAKTRAVRTAVNKRFGFKFKTLQEQRDFWNAYRQLEEEGKVEGLSNGSPQIISKLYEVRESPEATENLIFAINRANADNYEEDLNTEELREMAQNGDLIKEDGSIIHIDRTDDDFVKLMEEETNLLYKRGREERKRNEKQYNRPRPYRHR